MNKYEQNTDNVIKRRRNEKEMKEGKNAEKKKNYLKKLFQSSVQLLQS